MINKKTITMKYKILTFVIVHLILLNCTITTAQNNTVSAKEFMAHMDSIKAAKRNDKSFQLSILRNLRDEPLDVFYKRADSLNLVQPNLKISDSLLQELKEKDNGLPYHFLSKADALYSSNPEKLDDVAILMFVGLMRYDYYLGVYPGYAPNGEGWVTTNSFMQSEKLRVELYLQNNIEKYKAILQFAIKYCSENSYTFYKGAGDIMMFNKVMQPYKNLLKELETNNKNLVNQWAQQKKANLDPERLKNEALAKEQKKQSNKALFSNLDKNMKMQVKIEDLWAKIEEAKTQPDSSLLKQYVREFNKEKNRMDSVFMNWDIFKQPKQVEVPASSDTFKIFVRKGYPKIKLQDTTSKEEIYNYYDAVKGQNTMNYRIAKMNRLIIDYIKKYNWTESVKLKVFDIVKYVEKYFDDGYDQTKDLYLTKAEIQQREIKLKNYLRNNGISTTQKRSELIELLGDVYGTLVFEDVLKIKNKYLTDPIENLK